LLADAAELATMGIFLNRYLDGAPFDAAVGEIVSEVIFCGESLAAVLSCRLYGLR
jgi:hypothetical protein